METVIDDGRSGDWPPLEDYDDEMAAVCQSLGIEPKAWQAGGRTFAGAPFLTVRKTEGDCRAFVDSQGGRFVGESGFRRRSSEPWLEDKRRSHLIFAQYPKPTDVWALEAIKAATEEHGIRCSVTCGIGVWTVASWLEGGWQDDYRDMKQRGVGSGDLGPAALQALYATLFDPLKPLQARQRDKCSQGMAE